MNVRETLYKIYWQMQSIIAPALRYSQYLYEDVLGAHVEKESDWLDLGCGHHVLPPWRLDQEIALTRKCHTIVGLDYDFDSLIKHKTIRSRVRGDASGLPFRDNIFGLVTANMVVEHFDNPVDQFREVHRVLKPGGLFIFHTPNILGYTTIMARLLPESLKAKLAYLFEGRKEEDVFRTYYKANSRSKIRKLAKMIGFKVRKIRMIVSSAEFVVIPPLVMLELLWLRLLMTRSLRPLRTNIIAIYEKSESLRQTSRSRAPSDLAKRY